MTVVNISAWLVVITYMHVNTVTVLLATSLCMYVFASVRIIIKYAYIKCIIHNNRMC